MIPKIMKQIKYKMRSKLLTAAVIMLSVISLTSCKDKVSVSVTEGKGSVIYNGKRYSVNIATLISGESDGKYSNHITFNNSETGDYFSFWLHDAAEANTIPAGSYQVALTGDITSSFSVKESGITHSGPVSGTMTVTRNSDQYGFSFSGEHISDEGTVAVTFAYSGAVAVKKE